MKVTKAAQEDELLGNSTDAFVMQAASTGSGFGWENPVVVPLVVFQEIQDPQPEIFFDFLMIMKPISIVCPMIPSDHPNKITYAIHCHLPNFLVDELSALNVRSLAISSSIIIPLQVANRRSDRNCRYNFMVITKLTNSVVRPFLVALSNSFPPKFQHFQQFDYPCSNSIYLRLKSFEESQNGYQWTTTSSFKATLLGTNISHLWKRKLIFPANYILKRIC